MSRKTFTAVRVRIGRVRTLPARPTDYHRAQLGTVTFETYMRLSEKLLRSNGGVVSVKVLGDEARRRFGDGNDASAVLPWGCGGTIWQGWSHMQFGSRFAVLLDPKITPVEWMNYARAHEHGRAPRLPEPTPHLALKDKPPRDRGSPRPIFSVDGLGRLVESTVVGVTERTITVRSATGHLTRYMPSTMRYLFRTTAREALETWLVDKRNAVAKAEQQLEDLVSSEASVRRPSMRLVG